MRYKVLWLGEIVSPNAAPIEPPMPEQRIPKQQASVVHYHWAGLGWSINEWTALSDGAFKCIYARAVGIERDC